MLLVISVAANGILLLVATILFVTIRSVQADRADLEEEYFRMADETTQTQYENQKLLLDIECSNAQARSYSNLWREARLEAVDAYACLEMVLNDGIEKPPLDSHQLTLL